MKGSAAIQLARESIPIKLVEKDDFFDRMRERYQSIARRAFEIFEGNGRTFGRELNDWLRAESELLHPVHIEVSDSGDSYKVRAEVPGFTAKDLEISVESDRLTITGKRETKDERKKGGKIIHSEQCSDEILRVVELPVAVDTARVTATLKDGMLELEMPKAVPAKKIKVEPKAA